MDEQNNVNAVECTTRHGVKLRINRDAVKDTRFLYYLVKARDDSDGITRLKNMYSMLGILLGGDDNVIAFQNEIAAHNGGVCTNKELLEDLTDIFGALEIKNFSSSPA